MTKSVQVGYIRWVLVGILLFVLSLALGYGYAKKITNSRLDSVNPPQELKQDTNPTQLTEVEQDQQLVDLPELNTPELTKILEWLQIKFPDDIQSQVERVEIYRAQTPMAKDQYMIFQAKDETDPTKVTLGCSWYVAENVSKINLYVDENELSKTTENVEKKDTLLRGLSYCIFNSVAMPEIDVESKNQIFTELRNYLQEQGWVIQAD